MSVWSSVILAPLSWAGQGLGLPWTLIGDGDRSVVMPALRLRLERLSSRPGVDGGVDRVPRADGG